MNLRDLLEGDPVAVAPRLLGARLVSRVGGRTTALVLTEVEAYREDDPASHSYRGRTRRNLTMFGRAGLLYVYRSYGLHWCANVVTGPEGFGGAVLVRAGTPLLGRELMRERRGREDHLADGPGKVCQAMGIDGRHDGIDLLEPGSEVSLEPGEPAESHVTTPRIGISKAVDRPWRFVSEAGVGPR